MERSDNPISFANEIEFPNAQVSFLELMEICQGGPLVGLLSINGQLVSHVNRFGGPILYKDGYIYAPLFIRKFCVAGFRLCRISVDSLEVDYISKIKDLFYLDRIENGKIYFFEDVLKAKTSYLEI